MIRFIPAPFPVAARRTGRADFPHPALSGIMPSPTEGRASARTGARGATTRWALVSFFAVNHPSGASGTTTGGADALRHGAGAPTTAGFARRCRQFVDVCSTSSFAFACSALRSFSTVVGVARLIRQSPVARSCQHRSQTKGPSLHRHYPASPVLRPYPPPQEAGSVPRGTTVGQRRRANHPEGLPVLHTIPLRTCRRHYPGGTVGCACRSPSPTAAAFPESQAGRLPHCPFRGLLGVHCALRPVRSLSPFGPFYIGSFGCFVASTAVPSYRLERPLPGGNCTHWDRAPLHGTLRCAG